jgi:hypothetical protein
MSRGIIYDALAADYDGDSKLDLFVLYKTSPNQFGYNGGFLWGDRIRLSTLITTDSIVTLENMFIFDQIV